MPDQVPVVKAELRELNSNGEEVPNSRVPVQFNPETLKVSFSNQVQSGDQRGTTAKQFVGQGATKLSVQLWFDVTSGLPQEFAGIDDVRILTRKVAYFITPKDLKDSKGDPVTAPPGVRFLWGTFMFDGLVESLEESLELFSPEGKPLRASITIGMSQQKIEFAFASPKPSLGAALGVMKGALFGTQPLTQAAAGATLQGIAENAGKGDNWQAIAAANNIENPRLLKPGQLINLNIKL